MRCPLGREGLGQLGHSCFGGVVGTLLLRVQDAGAGDGGEEDDGAAGFGGDHVASAGLGYEERARQVYVEEVPEHGGVVIFGFYVGADREGDEHSDKAFWICPGANGINRPTYSTTPAELITMSTEPRSEANLATTSAIAFSSRTSTL